MIGKRVKKMFQHKYFQRGSYIVAYAFILPLFSLMLGVVFDLSMIYIYHTKLQNAVEACALAGARRMYLMDNNGNVYTTQITNFPDDSMRDICNEVAVVSGYNGFAVNVNFDDYVEDKLTSTNNVVSLNKSASFYSGGNTNDIDTVIGVGVYQVPIEIFNRYEKSLSGLEITVNGEKKILQKPVANDINSFPIELKVLRIRMNYKLQLVLLGKILKSVSKYPIEDGKCLLSVVASARGICKAMDKVNNKKYAAENVRLIN